MKKLGACLFALLLSFSVFPSQPTVATETEQIIRRPVFPRRPSPPKSEFNHIGGKEYDGHKITVDLPRSELLRNMPGRPTQPGKPGAGLCVFTAIDECARWQNVFQVVGFQSFMRQYPGGGNPSKVDAMLKLKAPGVTLDYIQDTSANIALLKSIMSSGRAAAVTYGYSPRYIAFDNLDGEIAHMVLCVLFDDKYMAFADNNFPDDYEWVLVDEGLRRWIMNDGGWLFAFLNPPPPPIPS